MALAVNDFNYLNIREQMPVSKKIQAFGKFMVTEISPTISLIGNANKIAQTNSPNNNYIMGISNVNTAYLNYRKINNYFEAQSTLDKAIKIGNAEFIEDAAFDRDLGVVSGLSGFLWTSNLVFTALGISAVGLVTTVVSPILGMAATAASLYIIYKDEQKNLAFQETLEGSGSIRDKMSLFALQDDPSIAEKNVKLETHLNKKNYTPEQKARLLKIFGAKNKNIAGMDNYLVRRVTPRAIFLIKQNQELINNIASGGVADVNTLRNAQAFLTEITKEAKIQSYIQMIKAYTVTSIVFVAFTVSVAFLFCTPGAVVALIPAVAFLISTISSIAIIAYNQYDQFLYGKMDAAEYADILTVRMQTDIAATNLLAK